MSFYPTWPTRDNDKDKDKDKDTAVTQLFGRLHLPSALGNLMKHSLSERLWRTEFFHPWYEPRKNGNFCWKKEDEKLVSEGIVSFYSVISNLFLMMRSVTDHL